MSKTTIDIQEMNIYQKLSGIRKMVEVIRKNRSGFNYKYVDEAEVLAHVSAGMDKYRVFIITEVVPESTKVSPVHYTKTKVLKDSTVIDEHVNEVLVTGELRFTLVNIDNPDDRLVVPWAISGQQADASQAFGSGLTYAIRYFFLKFFQIATPDADPDNWRQKQEEIKRAEDQAVADEILNDVHELVTAYLNQFKEDEQKKARATVISITKKYAKDENGKATGDYFKIWDPELASKLLNELKSKLEVKKSA